MRMTVFGSGSWGTALAHHAGRHGHEVMLWALEPEVAEGLNREHRNPLYVSEHPVDEKVRATTDLEEAAAFSDVWIWVVPVQHSRGLMERLTGSLRADVVMVSASKGLETSTMKRMDQLAWEVLNLPSSRFCALSGPTFAKEVLEGHPSAAVLACMEPAQAERLQRELSDIHLRCYAGRDLVGVELAGALKNVIAIAAGMVDALGYGANTQAALMTRGLHEITRLGVRLGADASTFRGLAGMGDLVLTCTGGLSRNRRVGQRIGHGETLEQVLGTMREVAEGVRTAPAAARLAREHGIEMPITEAVTAILAGEIEPREALKRLMTRELKPEAKL